VAVWRPSKPWSGDRRPRGERRRHGAAYATLIPAGLEVTRSPLGRLPVTVSVADWPGGVTVSVAVRHHAPGPARM